MKVVVTIAGREAIPVRAIPFLTGWEVLSPDVLANILAGEDGRRRLAGLKAWYIESGVAREDDLRSWSTIATDIGELEKRAIADGWMHPRWRTESLEHLPAEVFVWKDSFVEHFGRTYASNRPGKPTDPVEHNLADLSLNFSPRISGEEERLLREALIALEETANVAHATAQPPLQRFAVQESRIMEALRQLKLDSKSLPRPAPGKAGVKKQVRDVVLADKKVFVSEAVFDKAWDRLRSRGEIRDVPRSTTKMGQGGGLKRG